MSEWESCFDCKYCNVIDGMQSCVWHSGLRSSYHKCEKYKRDWFSTIMTFIMFIAMFILPLVILSYLVLLWCGWF